MRAQYLLAAVTIMALIGIACQGGHSGPTVQNAEPDTHSQMASNVLMGDPKAGAQLLSGFYGIENSAWRWTAGRFSVQLRTPPGAAQMGGLLSLSFTIPDVTIRKLHHVKITASINGMVLKSSEFDTAGAYVFSTDVPASMLAADSVKVDFVLDRSLSPGVDKRELGIIATSVGISPR